MYIDKEINNYYKKQGISLTAQQKTKEDKETIQKRDSFLEI